MTLKELRNVVEEGVTLWIIDIQDNFITANENKYLDNRYDQMEVVKIYNDKYPSISARGITVILNGE